MENIIIMLWLSKVTLIKEIGRIIEELKAIGIVITARE